MKRRALISGTLLSAMFTARCAEAHLVTTGLGPLYDGVMHVLLSPDDLLPVVAIALLAGLNGPTAGRRTLFALTATWLIAGAGGFLLRAPWLFGAATAASFLVLGILVAADRRLKPALVTALGITVGLLHGWLNGVAIAEAQREALGLVGIATTIFVIAAFTAAIVVSLRSGWTRVVVRVAGSWVAAIGLLMLGWGLHKP